MLCLLAAWLVMVAALLFGAAVAVHFEGDPERVADEAIHER